MAEVLAEFADPVATPAGATFRAQACGAPNGDGLWEGWIEFAPIGSGAPLRSARETTQPNRTDAVYWATGLTHVYLEGALERALNPVERKVVAPSRPMFDHPAAPNVTRDVDAPTDHRAVLDPFSVYQKGERLLRQELGALAAWHLVNIVQEFRLSDDRPEALSRMPASALVELIVAQVRAESLARR
jgi:hypothetical protein